MKRKIFTNLIILTLCGVIAFTFPGCKKEPQPPQPSPTQGAEGNILPTSNTIIDALDYAYMWYGYGLHSSVRHVFVQTGYYGFSFNADTAQFLTLGPMEKPVPKTEALYENNDPIKALPKIPEMVYTLTTQEGKTLTVSGTRYVHKEGIPMSSKDFEGKANPLRIINSGTYLQRCDVMRLVYDDDTSGYSGRCEFSASAGYLQFTYDASIESGKAPVSLSLTFTLPAGFESITVSPDGRSLIAKNADGAGYAFALPLDSAAALQVQGNVITISADVELVRRKWNGLSFTIIPRNNISQADLDTYYASQKVELSAQNIIGDDTTNADIEYNAVTGAFHIRMPNFSKFRGTAVEKLNAYERTPFTITNNSDKDVTVLLCFYKPTQFPYTNYSIWGMSPILVEYNTKEPVGIAVQHSRNPHNYLDDILYNACWVQCYVYVKIPAAKTVQYEFVTAYTQWGQTYAASMAQMCLVGWGGNQWWISSQLGSFGITFDYDPEMVCSRATLDDIGVIDVKNGMAAGGNEFLVLHETFAAPVINQKLNFKSPAPNLAELTLVGNTSSLKVKAEMGMHIARSRDYTKMFYTFKYTFVQDVKFSRLAFFTLGADNYNDKAYEKLVYGNEDGYLGEIKVPTKAEKPHPAYLEEGIEVTGSNIWAVQLGFKDEKYNYCDKAMVVREFNANINGTTYTTPALNAFVSQNGVTSMTCELTLPKSAGKTIKAGSVVTGCVEVVILPTDRDLYTGPNEYIKNLDASVFGKWEQAHLYAVNGKLDYSATVGELLSTWPAQIKAAAPTNGVVADFSITGGIGYVPVTITGLDSYSGYRLFKVENGTEVMVDQSVHGNDYWQCYYDVNTGKYELTFNVEQNITSSQYRLKKIS